MNFFGKLFARNTQTKRRSIVPVKLNLESLEERAVPASLTWFVNDYTDTGSGNTGVGSGQTGDLRYCINGANGNNSAGSTNLFQFTGTGSGPNITSQLPHVEDNQTWQGAVIISANANVNDQYTMLIVDSSANLTLGSVEMTGGDSTTANGGAIYNNGTVTLYGAAIVNNVGNYGGGVYNNTGATLNVQNGSQFKLNEAITDGGAIVNNGTVNFSNTAGTSAVTINDNYVSGASGNGGGIYNLHGTLTINCNVFIENNTAGTSGTGGASGLGGGIYNQGLDASHEATISMGTSGRVTMDNNAAQNGGGLYENTYSVVDLGHWLFTNNKAGSYGGAVYIRSSTNTSFDNTQFGDSSGTNKDTAGNISFGPGGYYIVGATLTNYPTDLTDYDDTYVGGNPMCHN